MVFCALFILMQSIPFLVTPEVQEATQRQISSGLEQVDLIKPDTLYNGGIIKTFENHIYVLDYKPEPRLLKINPETNTIVTEYGKGKGRGPGELLNPTDFDVTSNGSVWVADHPSSRIVMFGPQGSYHDEWVIKHVPYKISLTRSNEVFIHSTGDPTIKLADSLQNILWNSEQLVENPKRWAYVLNGFVMATEDERSALFISNYAGIIVKYNHNGSLTFARRTINYEQNISWKPIPGLDYRAFQIDRTSLDHAVANGFIKDDNIYVLVQFYGDGERLRQVIDVYSTVDGSYVQSMKVPEPVRGISYFAPADRLAGLQADQILMWEWME